jgi:hypothetical protein
VLRHVLLESCRRTGILLLWNDSLGIVVAGANALNLTWNPNSSYVAGYK